MNYVELVVDRPHEAHNTYLQMLAETGVVGLGLFLALLAVALASALRAARLFERAGERAPRACSRAASLVATIGLLTAAFFISAQITATVWVVLALGPLLLGVRPRRVVTATAGSRTPATYDSPCTPASAHRPGRASSRRTPLARRTGDRAPRSARTRCWSRS